MIHHYVGTKTYGKPYLLWFGACAPTNVLVYADSFESALEDAAQALHDAGKLGHFTEPDYQDALDDMRRESVGRQRPGWVTRRWADYRDTHRSKSDNRKWRRFLHRGATIDKLIELVGEEGWSGPYNELLEKVREAAETDLTYTESGYIPSWEWGGDGPVSKEQILETAHSGCYPAYITQHSIRIPLYDAIHDAARRALFHRGIFLSGGFCNVTGGYCQLPDPLDSLVFPDIKLRVNVKKSAYHDHAKRKKERAS